MCALAVDDLCCCSTILLGRQTCPQIKKFSINFTLDIFGEWETNWAITMFWPAWMGDCNAWLLHVLNRFGKKETTRECCMIFKSQRNFIVFKRIPFPAKRIFVSHSAYWIWIYLIVIQLSLTDYDKCVLLGSSYINPHYTFNHQKQRVGKRVEYSWYCLQIVKEHVPRTGSGILKHTFLSAFSQQHRQYYHHMFYKLVKEAVRQPRMVAVHTTVI